MTCYSNLSVETIWIIILHCDLNDCEQTTNLRENICNSNYKTRTNFTYIQITFKMNKENSTTVFFFNGQKYEKKI